jgi:hypothetical protein
MKKFRIEGKSSDNHKKFLRNQLAKNACFPTGKILLARLIRKSPDITVAFNNENPTQQGRHYINLKLEMETENEIKEDQSEKIPVIQSRSCIPRESGTTRPLTLCK